MFFFNIESFEAHLQAMSLECLRVHTNQVKYTPNESFSVAVVATSKF